MSKKWMDASEAIDKYEQQTEKYLEGERSSKHENIKAKNRHKVRKKEGGDKWVQKDQQTL
ncbi:hypothetical protein QEW_4545 [Clostridioides difficile CD160]|nr:hypothetical protein QEW_4545 [Clostridioides difficile CD160]